MDPRKHGDCRKIDIPFFQGMTASIMFTLMLVGCTVGRFTNTVSPVTRSHIQTINQGFADAGISKGYVDFDRQGRVELQGEYQDESQVDKAFSIAQTVVGVRWVSPVTPEHIKVAEWSLCLSNLLGGKPCGPARSVKAPLDELPPGPVAHKYALIVGVGRFRSIPAGTLKYASKDAADMYSYLTDPQGGNFDKKKVILLRDEDAMRGAIERVLDDMAHRAQENDLVLLYFSSHGTPPDKFGGVHIVTYDTEVKPREQVWRTSMTEDILRDFIQKLKVKRLMVVMDACYSNGAYSQIAGFLPTGGKSIGVEGEEGYGRSKLGMAQRLLGSKDLVIEEEISKPATLNASHDWGRVLISASDAGEKSWESDQIHNSFFTHYFIEGLHRYRGNIKEAFEYAKPLVTMKVKQEKDADQNPQLTPSRKNWNLAIATPES